MEVVIKIEVKDNNVDQALRILKRKLQREGFFKILKIKSNYEKPSERKKREPTIQRKMTMLVMIQVAAIGSTLYGSISKFLTLVNDGRRPC